MTMMCRIVVTFKLMHRWAIRQDNLEVPVVGRSNGGSGGWSMDKLIGDKHFLVERKKAVARYLLCGLSDGRCQSSYIPSL